MSVYPGGELNREVSWLLSHPFALSTVTEAPELQEPFGTIDKGYVTLDWRMGRAANGYVVRTAPVDDLSLSLTTLERSDERSGQKKDH